MSLSYCLIVNSQSNSNRALKTIEKFRAEIEKKLVDVEIYIISENESISTITEIKAKEFDVIVACGGDGTARSVAIGLRNTGKIFGLIPLGSGNDFAKMLNLNTDISRSIDILKQGALSNFDIIAYNDSYFINTLGIGFDGLTNFIASNSKYMKGVLKYILAGIKALFTYQRFYSEISFNGEVKKNFTSMIIIANGKWEGGKYFVSKNSLNNDGIIEVITLKNISKIQLAIEFIRLSYGKTLRKKFIEVIPVSEVTLKTSIPILFHADGEVETPKQNFKIKVLPKKIKTIYSET